MNLLHCYPTGVRCPISESGPGAGYNEILDIKSDSRDRTRSLGYKKTVRVMIRRRGGMQAERETETRWRD